MAAAALLRSLGSKMARAPPTLLARGLHGGARSWHGGSWTHGRLLHQRGLHHGLNSPNCGASGSKPPISEADLHKACSKIRAGVAYVMIFGTMVYMYLDYPRFEAELEAKLEARRRSKSTEAFITEALEILRAKHASVDSPDAHAKLGTWETDCR
ncbi:unnamed protein product [Urochloa humidicola]